MELDRNAMTDCDSDCGEAKSLERYRAVQQARQARRTKRSLQSPSHSALESAVVAAPHIVSVLSSSTDSGSRILVGSSSASDSDSKLLDEDFAKVYDADRILAESIRPVSADHAGKNVITCILI